MKNKRIVLSCLITLLTGVIYFSIQAQQKSEAQRADFSGVWKSKESISMGGNIVCSFDAGDRMLANTMKIIQQPTFLTIETSSSFPGEMPVAGTEKLTFDGKVGQIDHGPDRGKEFRAKWSADRQTLTVNSTVHLMIHKPYKENPMEQMLVYVTEVWELSDDGKTITIHSQAKEKSEEIERSWTTVFEKAN